MSSEGFQLNKFETLLQHLPAEWQELAIEKRAFRRSRQIKSPLELLRLMFSYLLADYSLRQTAAALISRRIWMSDQAVHNRLQHCRDWLAAVLGATLNQQMPVAKIKAGSTLRLRQIKIVDGTVLNCPGATGTHYLLHLCFDAVKQTISAIKLTGAHVGEGFKNFEFGAGDLVLGDRIYAKSEQIIRVVEQGADVLVRVSLQQLKLFDEAGKLIDWKANLAAATESEKFSFAATVRNASGKTSQVWIHGQRFDERGRERGRRKVRLQAIKTRCKTRAATILLSEWIVVLTTLEPSELSAQEALNLYRVRWQIEIYFKRLKMLLKLGRQRGKNKSALAEADIYGRLLVALLVAAESGKRLWSDWDWLKVKRGATSFDIWRMMLDELREAVLETRNWRTDEWQPRLRRLCQRKRKRSLQGITKEVLNKLKPLEKAEELAKRSVSNGLTA